MKKTVFLYNVFLTIFIASALLFTVACGAGLGDWEVELPNNYRVIHLNSQDIRISYDDKDGSSEKVKINSFIKEFAFDDRYVYARTIESILNNDISSEKYYVVDTQRALIELAKEANHTGVSKDEAKILMEWGEEYGLKTRGIERHLERSFKEWHIHIGTVNHIPVK